MKNWEFNILQIYNYNLSGKYTNLFNFIKKKHKIIEGDIIEAGVYRGSFLLSAACT